MIETKKMQYSYNDGDLYYFMDAETYDMIPLSQEQVADAIPYIRENDEVTIVTLTTINVVTGQESTMTIPVGLFQ